MADGPSARPHQMAQPILGTDVRMLPEQPTSPTRSHNSLVLCLCFVSVRDFVPFVILLCAP